MPDTPDETMWGAEIATEAEATETPATAEGTEAPEATEAVEAADGEAQETTEAVEADPWAQYRGENGLIGGKYQTPEEAVKAAVEADRLIAQRTFEAQQYQRMLEQFQPQGRAPQTDPQEYERLLSVPPVGLLAEQSFVNEGIAAGVEWNTDEDGYVIPNDPANLVNLNFVREIVRDKATGYRQTVQQQEQAAQQAETQFFTAYPELSDFREVVARVQQRFSMEGRFAGNDFKTNAALVAAAAKAEATQAAARLLGQQGGAAAAAARTSPVSPVGGTGRGGNSAPVLDETRW